MKKMMALLLVWASLTCLLCACGPKVTMERGVQTDSAYTNAVLELTFNLPDGWRFYTDDEIAEAMNISAEMFNDKNLLESSKITSVTDFVAVQNSTGNNVGLVIENLKITGNADITVEKYVDIAKTQLGSQLKNATYTFKPAEEAKLGNVDFLMLEAECSHSGIQMTQYMYLKKEGAHMVLITCTDVSGVERATFEQMFS